MYLYKKINIKFHGRIPLYFLVKWEVLDQVEFRAEQLQKKRYIKSLKMYV